MNIFTGITDYLQFKIGDNPLKKDYFFGSLQFEFCIVHNERQDNINIFGEQSINSIIIERGY